MNDLTDSTRAISELERYGPTDMGLVKLAERTQGILVTSEELLSQFAARMGDFASLRSLENLLVRYSIP